MTARSGDVMTLDWRVPGGGPFPMPVELQIDGELRRIDLPDGHARITVPAGAHVIVDPYARILKRSTAVEEMQADLPRRAASQ